MRHNEVEPLGSVELDADALYRELMSSLSSFLQDYGGELRRHWIEGKTRAEYLGVPLRGPDPRGEKVRRAGEIGAGRP